MLLTPVINSIPELFICLEVKPLAKVATVLKVGHNVIFDILRLSWAAAINFLSI